MYLSFYRERFFFSRFFKQLLYKKNSVSRSIETRGRRYIVVLELHFAAVSHKSYQLQCFSCFQTVVLRIADCAALSRNHCALHAFSSQSPIYCNSCTNDCVFSCFQFWASDDPLDSFNKYSSLILNLFKSRRESIKNEIFQNQNYTWG